MHTFRVVKDRDGWAVQLRGAMTTPFRLKAVAIQEADALCHALRRHGEAAEVKLDEISPSPSIVGIKRFSSAQSN